MADAHPTRPSERVTTCVICRETCAEATLLFCPCCPTMATCRACAHKAASHSGVEVYYCQHNCLRYFSFARDEWACSHCDPAITTGVVCHQLPFWISIDEFLAYVRCMRGITFAGVYSTTALFCSSIALTCWNRGFPLDAVCALFFVAATLMGVSTLATVLTAERRTRRIASLAAGAGLAAGCVHGYTGDGVWLLATPVVAAAVVAVCTAVFAAVTFVAGWISTPSEPVPEEDERLLIFKYTRRTDRPRTPPTRPRGPLTRSRASRTRSRTPPTRSPTPPTSDSEPDVME